MEEEAWARELVRCMELAMFDGGTLEEYGFGHFRSPPLMKLAHEAGLKLGVVSTSDSLDCSPRGEHQTLTKLALPTFIPPPNSTL